MIQKEVEDLKTMCQDLKSESDRQSISNVRYNNQILDMHKKIDEHMNRHMNRHKKQRNSRDQLNQ